MEIPVLLVVAAGALAALAWWWRRAVAPGEAPPPAARQARGDWLAVAFASLGEAIIATDQSGNISFLNAEAERLTGWTASEALLQPVNKVIQFADEQTGRPASGLLVAPEVQVDRLALIRRGGELVPVAGGVTGVKGGGGQTIGLVALLRDVTEARAMERHLLHTQKLEALGTLTAGLAHDFNNVLTIILGHAELMARQIERQEHGECARYAASIRQAALRGQQLVGQLLTFSRRSPAEHEPVDLAAAVHEAAGVLSSALPQGVELLTDIGDVPAPVRGVYGLLVQLVVNLGTNAVQAMPDGGVLRVTLERHVVDGGHYIRQRPEIELEGGLYYVLTVADTGEGMDEEQQARMFEPFYTTKPAGQGTGMGLAMVHGIVADHHGVVLAESEPGVGTAFMVFLPALEVESMVESQSLDIEALPRCEGSVLVVDDEPLVVEFLVGILVSCGFEVEASATPGAVMHYDLGAFDLAIVDSHMPGMSGADLIRHIRRQRPELPVVMITGYIVEDAEAIKRDLGLAALMLKPIRATDLISTLVAILEEPRE